MVGMTTFDPRISCPFPHMTQPVLPGEEFEALEYVSRNDFKWVLSWFERPFLLVLLGLTVPDGFLQEKKAMTKTCFDCPLRHWHQKAILKAPIGILVNWMNKPQMIYSGVEIIPAALSQLQ